MIWRDLVWCAVGQSNVWWCAVLLCGMGQGGAQWCGVVWSSEIFIQKSAEPFKILLPHCSCFSSSSAGSMMQMKREECEMKGQRAIWQSAALLRSTEWSPETRWGFSSKTSLLFFGEILNFPFAFQPNQKSLFHLFSFKGNKKNIFLCNSFARKI